MRLAEYLTEFALRANNVCLFGQTRRAPSPHCTDARVYGHTITAMHGMRTPLPPLHISSRGRNFPLDRSGSTVFCLVAYTQVHHASVVLALSNP